MILIDTNIIIEVYRSNDEIIDAVNEIGQEYIAVSDITCSELFFGARNKREHQAIDKDLSNLTVIPIDMNISKLSVELIKKYALSHKLTIPDALIAATSIVYKIPLYTLNVKDFVYIQDIKLYSDA
ncbi:MAG: type II toxin-antitoxin system VapC family toxin [Bacteroidia bacterium]|nr:type II toxin-antitoxin system VapC family toxin [Bacteroidia bacterium]